MDFWCRISKGQRYTTVYARDFILFLNEGEKKNLKIYGIRFFLNAWFVSCNKKNTNFDSKMSFLDQKYAIKGTVCKNEKNIKNLTP